MTIKESHLRDYLSQHLTLIENGLILVDDEFYLKNKFGTKGFVDILARDSKNCLVVIEIKISKHSERDAITELFKYLALLKQSMSVKDSEIRLFVISTDWRELIIPFAEFHRNTHFNSTGLYASIEKDIYGEISSLKLNQIDLPNEEIGRMLIPRHWLQIYSKKSNRDELSKEYAEKIKTRGIENFIILRFCFDYFGEQQYGFYFAQQQENLSFYKNILQNLSQRLFDETLEYTSDFSDDDDILYTFADAAIDMIDVLADDKEIGHPEKIKGYLERKLWQIESIDRFGKFKTDIRLKDQEIIHDLCGYTGGSHIWYFATCLVNNKAHIQEIINKYHGCLYHNDIWRRSISDYLSYAQTKAADSSLHLSIFNPENILHTIALMVLEKESSYQPAFTLILDCPSEKTIEIFKGFISIKHETIPNIHQIIQNYFNGDEFCIALYNHLHTIAKINTNIMSDLGLEYSIKYLKIKDGVNTDECINPVVRSRTISSNNKIQKNDLIFWIKHNKKTVDKILDIHNASYPLNTLNKKYLQKSPIQ